ncbi:MAG: hypothetical protein K8L99_29585, partial [Anaerolineae bacterium]|nr:hypothetical protein [Anaerolineae bacterium]
MGFIEPPRSPDDTAPTGTIQQVEIESSASGWRRAAGCVTLLLAAVLTIATAIIVLLPPSDEAPPPVVETDTP